MSDTITIRKADGTWVVRAGGAVLVESRNALELRETGHDPVVYFPRADIAMAFLDRSETRTTCPHKGEAEYFSIVTKSKTIRDAAWRYAAPHRDVAEIADHLAFHSGDDITVEHV